MQSCVVCIDLLFACAHSVLMNSMCVANQPCQSFYQKQQLRALSDSPDLCDDTSPVLHFVILRLSMATGLPITICSEHSVACYPLFMHVKLMLCAAEHPVASRAELALHSGQCSNHGS